MERIGLAPGSEVGGYRIVGPLGSGGMGAVYRAADGGGHEVALKLLHPHIGADPQARERLRREVSALQRLRHPSVAAVLDAEADSSEAFIVTELVDGENLADHVRARGPLDGAGLHALARGLQGALGAVHAAGVIHRDLKPSNVVLTATGPVLIDFGIAQGVDDSRLTSTGIVLGTPGYLAPELLDGAEPDEASDWWGWAAILAFAATGRDPFGSRPVEAVLAKARAGEVDLTGLGPLTTVALRGALDPVAANRVAPDDVITVLENVAARGDGTTVTPPTEHAAATAVLAGPALAPTQVMANDGHTRAWSAADQRSVPQADHRDEVFVADPHELHVEPRDELHDEHDDAFDEDAYAAPVPPRRPGTLLVLLLLAVAAAPLAPGVVAIVVGAFAVLFGIVQSSAAALESRRERRGAPARGDVLRASVSWPWHVLRGAAIALPSLLVAASVVVVVGGIGWWLLDTGRLVVPPVRGGGGTAAGGGNEPWVYVCVIALAMLGGIATLWGGPFARHTRLGARRTLARIAPGRSGAMVLVAAALVGIAIAVVLLVTGQATWWWPLPGPPSLS